MTKETLQDPRKIADAMAASIKGRATFNDAINGACYLIANMMWNAEQLDENKGLSDDVPQMCADVIKQVYEMIKDGKL